MHYRPSLWCLARYQGGYESAEYLDWYYGILWIGQVPPEISGRRRGAGKEWVAAGYTGDGMCAAWGAAEEVVTRILGVEGGVGVIEEMDVTVERVERAKCLERLVRIFFG